MACPSVLVPCVDVGAVALPYPRPRTSVRAALVADAEPVDAVAPVAECSRCDAVCCRLTVVVQPEDGIAEHLTTVTDRGLRVMARDEEGWCVAIDAARMCCSIYNARPEVCRRFRMGGPYCEAVREDYSRHGPSVVDIRSPGGNA